MSQCQNTQLTCRRKVRYEFSMSGWFSLLQPMFVFPQNLILWRGVNTVCLHYQARAKWYSVMSAYRNKTVQEKGFVLVLYEVGCTFEKLREMVQGAPPYLSSLPGKVAAMHFCYGVATLKLALSALLPLVPKRARVRFRPHYGTYGVPSGRVGNIAAPSHKDLPFSNLNSSHPSLRFSNLGTNFPVTPTHTRKNECRRASRVSVFIDVLWNNIINFSYRPKWKSQEGGSG